MNDIDIAKKLLLEENLSVVFIKKGEVIYKSKERGIKPLYVAVTTKKEEIKDCSVADKVVGKSAAWLYVYANIKNVYCNIIAKDGSELLKENGINTNFNIAVDFIKNRRKEGMCPVEKLAKDEVILEKLLENIKGFLINNNLIWYYN